METIAKPVERTAERSRLRFWALVFLLGPLPVCGSLGLLFLKWMPNEIGPVETCAFFGALWGLASGVSSGHLARAFIGLNGGAVVGLIAGSLINLSNPNQRVYASMVVAVAMGFLAGLLRMQAPHRVKTVFKGMAAGFCGLLAMCITFFASVDMLRNSGLKEETGLLLCAFVASAIGIAILMYGMRPSPAQTGCPSERSSSKT